jgi:diguanylate cyclase (GGDEF)-like protein/PAS domain S-box-containing protein
MRFDAALGNMPHGLSMFDASERLLVANGRYRDIYGLTEEQVRPGTPLKTILGHFGVANSGGDFSLPQVAQGARERVPQLLRLADGRIILITRTPMADGGWVATHQDITEQRRIEGELVDKAADLARMNECFDAALNNMSQGLCLFGADQKVVVSNHQFAEIYRLDPDQVRPGVSLQQIFEARQRNGTAFLEAAKSLQMASVNEASRVEELVDGRFVSITHHEMADGGWLTAHEDITGRRKTEQERDRNHAFLHQIIAHIPTLITVKNARDRRYVLLNRVAEAAVGPSSEVVGKTAYEVFSRQAADLVTEEDESALRSESGMYQAEHEFEISRGNTRFFATKRVTIRDVEGAPEYLINLVEDVTERKVSSDRIAHLAHHDQLTGLSNRARFADKLDEAARRCARHGSHFTVLMLDLDRFKHVNDTLGHPAGDQLLVQVAGRLKSSLRDTDVLARLGGDEFAIIQEGESNQREGAIGLALRIIDIICEPFDLGGHEARIGTSIGIAFAPECGLEAESLLKKADLALYEAKSAGRNDYRLFEPEMAEVSDTQKMLEGELRQAIQNDEFELFYQPVIDTRTGATRGMEALVRWRHPTRGLVLPDSFIPLAESTGLMMPLGEWILQQACRDAASWPSDLKVAVNISAVQFNSARLFDIILCSLVESGLSPERLELEITETMLLKNEQECLVVIRQLKNLGISIVLDDFGVGYSSSSYLTRVPFDKIKIDKSFVQGFPQRRECAAIIQSVLALARGLDMSVTAEGVETREQFEALKAAGADLVQGYLFGRPAAQHELAWIKVDPQSQNVA